jgi:hypothetical protein
VEVRHTMRSTEEIGGGRNKGEGAQRHGLHLSRAAIALAMAALSVGADIFRIASDHHPRIATLAAHPPQDHFFVSGIFESVKS